MNRFRPLLHHALLCLLALCLLTAPALADGETSYNSGSVAGFSTNYVTIDMSAGVRAGVMLANSSIISTQSVTAMAQANGAIAAVNGTYFEAYNGVPVPWGTIIKDGKLLYTGAHVATVGITSTGQLLVDRVSISFTGYVNGELKFYPWWINHSQDEAAEGIAIYTCEYTTPVTPPAGARVVLADSANKVTSTTSGQFTVPSGGYALVFNAGVANKVDDIHVGDTVTYSYTLNTTFTDASQWADVQQALSAGPSLIINGTVTASGEEEGFFEAKVNTNRAGRSFIGGTADGKIIIGNIGSATLAEAASVCQSLGLVNAMCLDGGGSIALYHNGSGSGGRDVNNALGFFLGGAPAPAAPAAPAAEKAEGRPQSLSLGGSTTRLYAYNIGGNNYFKLRDLAALLAGSEAEFSVGYDSATKAITLQRGGQYVPVGGEGELTEVPRIFQVQPSQATLYVNGVQQEMTAYNIEGNNYFKLRDLGQIMDFGVGYDAAAKLVVLDPATGYSE